MSPDEEQIVVIECGDCGGDVAVGGTCDECGWSEASALAMADAERVTAKEPELEPVYWKPSDVRALPRHEPAWCPHCVAFLRWFATKAEARAYEKTLEDHPIEYCLKRQAKLNGSEEWRLRQEAGKAGSLAMTPPAAPRVPSRKVAA